MATAIEIKTIRNTDSKGITITSESYLDLITSITLNFYTTSADIPLETYDFTAGEVSSFISNGTISLSFLSMSYLKLLFSFSFIIKLLHAASLSLVGFFVIVLLSLFFMS